MHRPSLSIECDQHARRRIAAVLVCARAARSDRGTTQKAREHREWTRDRRCPAHKVNRISLVVVFFVATLLAAACAPAGLPIDLEQCGSGPPVVRVQACIASSDQQGWNIPPVDGFQDVALQGTITSVGRGLPPAECLSGRPFVMGGGLHDEDTEADWFQLVDVERTWTVAFRVPDHELQFEVGEDVTVQHRAHPLFSLAEQEIKVSDADGTIAYAMEAHSLDVASLLDGITASVGEPECYSRDDCGARASHALALSDGDVTVQAAHGMSAELAGLEFINALTLMGYESNIQCLDYVGSVMRFAAFRP
jgi:hypothetical protein